MKSNYLKKIIVFVLVILFFGASFIPLCGSDYVVNKSKINIGKICYENVHYVEIEERFTNPKKLGVFGDGDIEVLDQQQTEDSNRGWLLTGAWWFAQGFRPTLTVLTKVQLNMFKVGNPSGLIQVVVSIRDSLDGSDLTSTYVLGNQFTPHLSWVEFDFPDLEVIPNKKYYIVCRAGAGSLDKCYAWGFAGNDPYKKGYSYYSIRGRYWEILNDYDYPFPDFCFMAYGIDKPPGEPIIIGPRAGEAGINYGYRFSSIDPENHDVYLYIDWGDNNNTGWIGPYYSGYEKALMHTWSEEGTYILRVKAKDTFHCEGSWTTLEISMPKNKPISRLYWFLEEHPRLFPILRQILKI